MVTDYLFMESLLVERVKASVSGLKAVLAAPDLAKMAAQAQISPAAHVIYVGEEAGNGTGDQGTMGKAQLVVQLWAVVIAVYHADATDTGSGILGHVKRAGTAGDVMAPMIADALITQAAAARQRGTNVLADTGRGATYSLSLPVLAETGIIDPGTLVRYVDNGKPTIGVVKGVSANALLPSVRQTIEVQTHG